MKKWEKPKFQDLNLSFTETQPEFQWCPVCCKGSNPNANPNSFHEDHCTYTGEFLDYDPVTCPVNLS